MPCAVPRVPERHFLSSLLRGHSAWQGSLLPVARECGRDMALAWPFHSVFLLGLESGNCQLAPGQLGWLCHEPCQDASPPLSPAMTVEHCCSHQQLRFRAPQGSPTPFPYLYFPQLPHEDGTAMLIATQTNVGHRGSWRESFGGSREESNPNLLSLGTVGCPGTLMGTSTVPPRAAQPSLMSLLVLSELELVPQVVCPSQVKQVQSSPGACRSKSQWN